MHRVFCEQINPSNENITFTDKKELHHLKNVLRLKRGDHVEIFDGIGQEGIGKILSISPQEANILIETIKHIKPKTPSIILACAIPKKSKFELIIEKATELGVDEIIPLKTHRTQVQLKGERLDKKTTRFQSVAISAAKQSKRSAIPIIHPITSFSNSFKLLKNTTIIIPSLEKKRIKLFDTFKEIKTPEKIAFFIGPEGDFTSEEYIRVTQEGGIAVTLGKTILRVETAAICALSCANIFYHS